MSALAFEIVATCPATRARAGLLRTPHGVVETPVFMPVGTYGSVKGLTPRHLAEELDVRLLLANTYHLHLRPGHEVIRRLGGLHRFMAWPRAILTDSGGYQVFSLDSFREVTDEGVIFRSHLNGDLHRFTPESAVEVQLALSGDIMMALDECPPYPVSHETARQSMERTLRWARQGYAYYRRRLEELASATPPAWFPIVQGSMYADLRRECARRLVELDAPGYAVGGLSVGEPRALSLEMVDVTVPELPADRPRYVMGVGLPEELVEYVARGVDMMDCVLPTRNARNGCLFTSEGRLLIKQARYRDDPEPPDPVCGCYTCRHFSRAYLRHLFQAGEMLFATLATLHNLTYYLNLMRSLRRAIMMGTLPEYLRAVRSVPA
ncbi:MAG: tRNA guanosine(34) transglycosylase Tgt [Bryobacterales bacterium]|nr:tRNA guanosine(34) transglycosylase Tgt [Bryobacteraceae bacterium]MDW8353265.1 tRNA guanosine(34) transglycosylase Tgt [Bryobacterales bacterium]